MLTMADEYLDIAGVARKLGVSAATVSQYRWREGDKFPQPDLTIGRSPAWKPETIDAWTASRPGKGAGGGRPKRED